jgi:phosphatidylinositol glycan class K
VKRLGIPDSNIILMLADDIACNSRFFALTKVSIGNKVQEVEKGTLSLELYIIRTRGVLILFRKLDLYGENIEIDYRGRDVSVKNLIRLLTNRFSTLTQG